MADGVEVKDGWAAYSYKAGSKPGSVEFTPDGVAPTLPELRQAVAMIPAALAFEYRVRYVVLDGVAFILPERGIRVAGG